MNLVFLPPLIVLLAALYPLARRIGEVVPVSATLLTAVFMVFAVPRLPHSPIACLAQHQACDRGSQTDWLAWLCLIVPMGAGCAARMLQDHGRRQRLSRRGRPR